MMVLFNWRQEQASFFNIEESLAKITLCRRYANGVDFHVCQMCLHIIINSDVMNPLICELNIFLVFRFGIFPRQPKSSNKLFVVCTTV